MQRAKKFLVYHRAALVLSLLISLVYGSYHLFLNQISRATGAVYFPVAIEGHFDEGYYALRAASVKSNGLIVGDIALSEHQGSPAFLPILNPIIISVLGKVFGSIKNAVTATSFFFPPIIVFFVYLIIFELTGRRLWSILFAAVFMIAPKFGLFPSTASLPFFDGPRDLYFGRIDYPSVTYPFFAATFYLILRTLTRLEHLVPYLAGLAFGLLFYTYFYDWTYFAVVLAILFGFFVLTGDRRRVVAVAKIGVIGAAVSFYYWLNFFRLRSLPAFPDLLERIGVEKGRAFRLAIVWTSYLRALILVGVLWFLEKRRAVFAFCAAVLLPVFAVLNIQLVTGFVPQPDHWHRVFFLAVDLAVFLIIFVLGRRWLGRLSKILPIGLVLVTVGILVIYGFYAEGVVARENFPLLTLNNNSLSVYQWLKDYSDEGAVVVAMSARVSDELVLFTQRKVFVPNGLNTVSPTAEIWQRSMIAAAIFGLTPEQYAEYVTKNVTYLFADQYADHSFNSSFRPFKRVVPDDLLATKTREYELEYYMKSFKTPFRLDFLIASDNTAHFSPRTGFASRLVFESGPVKLYELTSEVK